MLWIYANAYVWITYINNYDTLLSNMSYEHVKEWRKQPKNKEYNKDYMREQRRMYRRLYLQGKIEFVDIPASYRYFKDSRKK